MFFAPGVLCTAARLGRRNIHTSQIMKGKAFDKWTFHLNQYPRYGLYTDDLLDRNDPCVIEAERRMPEEERTKMIFRTIQANQMLINHVILPKSEWTKYENDVPYLRPYLDEVLEEKREREEWEANY